MACLSEKSVQLDRLCFKGHADLRVITNSAGVSLRWGGTGINNLFLRRHYPDQVPGFAFGQHLRSVDHP